MYTCSIIYSSSFTWPLTNAKYVFLTVRSLNSLLAAAAAFLFNANTNTPEVA